MDQNGMFGEILETGQTTVKNAAKQTVSDFAQTVKGQITGSQTPQNQGTNEQANAGQASQQQQMTDQERVEFLKNLYGKSNKTQTSSQSQPPAQNKPISQALGIPQSDPNKNKTPEETAKIEALRRQLHGDYYQSLTNPQKPPEENVTEKLEREEQEEKMEDLQKAKEKPDPLQNVKTGTGERVVGVSG